MARRKRRKDRKTRTGASARREPGNEQPTPGDSRRAHGEHDLYNVSEEITDYVTDKIFDLLIDESGEKRRLKSGKIAEKLDEDVENAIKTHLIPKVGRIAARQISTRLSEEFREQYHADGKLESIADKGISGARWIMAAVYIMLAFTLCSILIYTAIDVTSISIKTVKNVAYFAENWNAELTGEAYKKHEEERGSLTSIIAPTIKLLDLVLIGSLVVMVLIGGYENTVSRIGMKHSMPVWLGKLTISELKVKVSASIVIISSIHLLMEFLRLNFPGQGQELEVEYYTSLLVTSLIHLVFIFSAMAITKINQIEIAGHHAALASHTHEDGEKMKSDHLSRYDISWSN